MALTFEEFQVAITVRPVASSTVQRAFYGITVQPERGTTSRTYRGPAGGVEDYFAEEFEREAQGTAIFTWQDLSTPARGIGLRTWTEPRRSPFERHLPQPLSEVPRTTLLAHLARRWDEVKPPPPAPPVAPVDPARLAAMRKDRRTGGPEGAPTPGRAGAVAARPLRRGGGGRRPDPNIQAAIPAYVAELRAQQRRGEPRNDSKASVVACGTARRAMIDNGNEVARRQGIPDDF